MRLYNNFLFPDHRLCQHRFPRRRESMSPVNGNRSIVFLK